MMQPMAQPMMNTMTRPMMNQPMASQPMNQAQPMARPFGSPAYAGPRSPSRKPKIPMPADYDPKHPPIGFMPDLPEGMPDEYMGRAMMFDESSGMQQMGQRRGRAERSEREERRAQRRRAKTAQSSQTQAARPTQAGRSRVSAEAGAGSEGIAAARESAAAVEANGAAVQTRESERQRGAKPRRTEAAPPDQSASAADRSAGAAGEGTPSMLRNLQPPIECLLMMGESATTTKAGMHTVKLRDPVVVRGGSFAFKPETRTIEIREDGVYHFTYSGRVDGAEESDAEKNGRWGRSGLAIVHEKGDIMHAIQVDHEESTPFRASFLGECVKGECIRLRWTVESAETALTLCEPILFVERLK
jgi:hypothetical protein